jgi:DNA-directed RNA polymerase subunit RPC12/RpoP
MTPARDAVRQTYARAQSYLPDADTMRVVCSWCKKTLKEGTGETSHSACPRCERKLLADLALREIRAYGKACRRIALDTGPDDEWMDAWERVVHAVLAIVDGGEK